MTSPTPYQLLPRLSDDEYEALKAAAQSVAAAAVDVINSGRGGKKLPSWWREDTAANTA